MILYDSETYHLFSRISFSIDSLTVGYFSRNSSIVKLAILSRRKVASSIRFSKSAISSSLSLASCSIFLIIGSFLFVSCGRFADIEKLPKTTMEFKHPHRKYYPILKGKILKMSYKYTNTGEAPLVISEIQTSCNCTISEFTKRAVGKGKSGYINLSFNSSKNTGRVKQYITIITNVKNTLSNNISFETNVVLDSDYGEDYEEVFLKDSKIDAIEGKYVPVLE